MPIANRPVMAYMLDLLKKHRITDLGVTLQYQPEVIKGYFGDGRECGVRLTYFTEELPLGTAGSVKNAQKFLNETFLVLSGDILTDFDLTAALQRHREKKALATLVLTLVGNPVEYGVVITDSEGKITRFLEKPTWGEVFSDQVNTGIYILEPKIFDFIPPGKPFDFSKDLFPLLLAKGENVLGVVLPGYWCDIGSSEAYLQAHYDFLSGKLKFQPPGKKQGGVWIGEGTEISPRVSLEGPVVIGNFCRIEPGVEIKPPSVIGDGVLIEEQASVKRSIVWEHARLGKKAALRGAVVGRKAIVETGAALYEGAILGDESCLQKYGVLKPGVKVWPRKVVVSGTSLNNNLVWGECPPKNFFNPDGVTGTVNLTFTPEAITRLGAAYGSILPKGSEVALSTRATAATQMLKAALVAGLLSTGVKVVDLGELLLPVHQFALKKTSFQGSIHLCEESNDTQKIWLHFFDARGIELGREEQRKVETFFWREEFRRISAREIQLVLPGPDFKPLYREAISSLLSPNSFTSLLRLVIIYPHLQAASLLDPVLERLGIEVQARLNEENLPFNVLKRKGSYLARDVLRQKAFLGVAFDAGGEELLLVSDQGQIVTPYLLPVLTALLLWETNQGGAVVAPVNAPQILEQLALPYGGEVIRTAAHKRAIKEKLFTVYPWQVPLAQINFEGDAFFTFLTLLAFLKQRNCFLSQVLAKIPFTYTAFRTVPCPREVKGRIMRELLAVERNSPVQLLDGIKIFRPEGWVLIFPHQEEPLYQIYSESFSQEVAEELTHFYTQKVNQILRS